MIIQAVLIPKIQKLVKDERDRLVREQLTPWLMGFASGNMKVENFYKKKISYTGVKYAGSTRDVFWSRYIEPFLEDFTAQLIAEISKECLINNLSFTSELRAVSENLKGMYVSIFNEMARIDQIMVGAGASQKPPKTNVYSYILSMNHFLAQHISMETEKLKARQTTTDSGNINGWTARAVRALEDVYFEFHQERMKIDEQFVRSGAFNSSRRIIEYHTLTRNYFAIACETVGKTFNEAGLSGEFSLEDLAKEIRLSIDKFWNTLELELKDKYIETHKKNQIRPTWEEFEEWREREIQMTVDKFINPLFASETPNIKTLKATTPENWRTVFSFAEEDDLYAIIDGGRVVASPIILERARSELRRREKAEKTIPTVTRIKSEKFGILDSPSHRDSDLRSANGIFGLACIYLDIDDFKALNTRFSEEMVDKLVLPPFHTILNSAVIFKGFAYAIGGDEVCILLPNHTLNAAKVFADDLRDLISSESIVMGEESLTLQVSIGISHTSANDEKSALYLKANKAMREAKALGKNRNVVWEEFIGL